MKFAILAILILAIAHAGLAPAPNLSMRNYYNDEVKLDNPCLKEHGFEYPWSELCQGQGILKTDYGATIAGNMTVYTWDNQSGRLDGILWQDGFRAVPYVWTGGYKDADAVKYATRVYDTINTINQYQCLAKKVNCLTLLTPEVRFPTENLITGIHFNYPYIHVRDTDYGWCFEKP